VYVRVRAHVYARVRARVYVRVRARMCMRGCVDAIQDSQYQYGNGRHTPDD